MFGVIHSKWKKFLLMEAAKSVEDIITDSDLLVKIYRVQLHGVQALDVRLTSKNETTIAEINIREAMAPVDGKCMKCYVVDWSKAHIPNWGPLMYDIALEIAGSHGLAPDRVAVSDEAETVWAYYLKNRHDVKWKQLDDEFGTLTPDNPEDDCSQTAARRRVPDKLPKDKKWVESPLSKVYYKTGTPLLSQLKRYKKIVDEREDSHGANLRSN